MSESPIHRVADDTFGALVVADDDGLSRRALVFRNVDHANEPTALGILGYEEQVRALRDALTAWLDAPRLAAREHAEVVHEDDGVTLLKTSAGEWGVRVDDGNAPGEFRIGWCSDEESARRAFDAECEKVTCEDCEQRVSVDEAHTAGDCHLCDDCHEAAVRSGWW